MPTTAAKRRWMVWRRRLKKPLFAIVPAVVLLLGATVVVRSLEEREVIETHRPDDVAVANPGTGLKRVVEDGREYFLYGPRGLIPLKIPVNKDKDTWRAIMVGGSFAMGSPYVHQDLHTALTGSGGIPDWMGTELAHRFPSKNIEVFNAAAGGQNAARVRKVVADLLPTAPDVLVVATGNNEGYVPATPFNDDLHDWIVYRAMKKVLIGKPRPEARSYFTPQDEDTQKIVAQYREAINGILNDATGQGIPVVLCTLPINLRYKKDVSTHGKPILYPTDDEKLIEGNRYLNEKKYEQAIDAYSKSRSQAYAARFIAFALERLERYDEAREFYKIYVEHNPNNRMRPSFNEFLRQVSQEKSDVHLVDLEAAMEAITEHGIPGHEYFLDYCHLSWRGYWEMSKPIVDRIIDANLIHGKVGEPKDRPTVGSLILDNQWDALMSHHVKKKERDFQSSN